MNLNDVHQGVTRHRKPRRLGRGTGSGQGKTAGRGHKGQFSRRGHSQHPAFQGGAMPLYRRIPKRGFHNSFAPRVGHVNLAVLETAFQAGDEVSPQTLREKGLVKFRYDQLKVLGNGTLTKKLTVSAHRFSKKAREKIEQAGGQAVELGKSPG